MNKNISNELHKLGITNHNESIVDGGFHSYVEKNYEYYWCYFYINYPEIVLAASEKCPNGKIFPRENFEKLDKSKKALLLEEARKINRFIRECQKNKSALRPRLIEDETSRSMGIAGENLKNQALYQVPLSFLETNPEQPRKYFDREAMQELKDSIENIGILQPIVIDRMEGNRLVVVAGERRYQAAKELGLKTILAKFIEGSQENETALIENLQRENLAPIEEAEALICLKYKGNYSLKELAEKIGKASSTVSEILSLARLPESIKNICKENPKIPKRFLVKIAKSGSEKTMLRLLHEHLNGKQTQVKPQKFTPASWRQKIRNFRKKIETIDLEEMENDRLVMEAELRELNLSIDQLLHG